MASTVVGMEAEAQRQLKMERAQVSLSVSMMALTKISMRTSPWAY